MKLALVVFDWAGTLIDFGCRAPLLAFLEAFDEAGLPIDEATARRPMGAAKREHVREILRAPEIAERALSLRGHAPDEALGERIYAAFERRLLERLPEHATPIAGAVETVAQLRSAGIALGSTTGYTRRMMERVLPRATAAGLRLDALICADEVPEGRPAPWACLRLAERFGVHPLARAVKIGDTPLDMAEGRNAGMRCIGVTASGNEVGLAEDALAALGPAERGARLERAERALRAAGAELVVPSVAELPRELERALSAP